MTQSSKAHIFLTTSIYRVANCLVISNFFFSWNQVLNKVRKLISRNFAKYCVWHSVENTKSYCRTQKKSWNQFTLRYFSQNVHFTEFFHTVGEKFSYFHTVLTTLTIVLSTSVCSVPLRSLKEGIMLLPIRGWNGDLCANFAPLCLDKNGFESLKIVYLVSKAQCGNFIIFLLLKFYVQINFEDS